MNTYTFPRSLSHSRISRLLAMLLTIVAWSIPTFCGEIHEAARDGDLQKVKALLKDNPELIFRADSGGQTPLHSAAFKGQKNVVKLLLANKAGINAKDNYGLTPLHSAALEGQKEVAELLLANKANVDAKNNDGKTPLYYAGKEGNKNLVELLRQHGGHE